MYFYPRGQQFLLVSDSFIKPQKKTTAVQTRRKSLSALAYHHLFSELLLIKLMLWLAIKTNSLS